MKTAVGFVNFCGRACMVLCLLVVVVGPAFAFDDPPMRVARLNYMEGRVSFQPGGGDGLGLGHPEPANDSGRQSLDRR
jgi:hypothetical protein